MLGTLWQRRLVIALLPIATACGSAVKSQVHSAATNATASARPVATADVPPPVTTPVAQSAPVEDPIATLIAETHLRPADKWKAAFPFVPPQIRSRFHEIDFFHRALANVTEEHVAVLGVP